MDELIAGIANIGFPIAISCFLLVRLEHKLEELTSTIARLTTTIEKWEKGAGEL